MSRARRKCSASVARRRSSCSMTKNTSHFSRTRMNSTTPAGMWRRRTREASGVTLRQGGEFGRKRTHAAAAPSALPARYPSARCRSRACRTSSATRSARLWSSPLRAAARWPTRRPYSQNSGNAAWSNRSSSPPCPAARPDSPCPSSPPRTAWRPRAAPHDLVRRELDEVVGCRPFGMP